jgi:hypothetical protein
MEYSQLSGNNTFLISLAVTTGEPNTTDSDEVISGEDSGRTDFQSRWCRPSEYNRAVDARNWSEGTPPATKLRAARALYQLRQHLAVIAL